MLSCDVNVQVWKTKLIYSNCALWLSGRDNCKTFVIKNNSDIGEPFFVISCCWKAVEEFLESKNVHLLLMLLTVLLKNNILQIKRHLYKLLLIGNINQDDNAMIWYDNDDEGKSYNLFVKDWLVKTTFTFHFSFLTLSSAFLSINNREMKRESSFILAMASQPFC